MRLYARRLILAEGGDGMSRRQPVTAEATTAPTATSSTTFLRLLTLRSSPKVANAAIFPQRQPGDQLLAAGGAAPAACSGPAPRVNEPHRSRATSRVCVKEPEASADGTGLARRLLFTFLSRTGPVTPAGPHTPRPGSGAMSSDPKREQIEEAIRWMRLEVADLRRARI